MTPREYAATLYGQISDSQIAMRLAEAGWQVDPQTVRAWRQRAGVPAYRPRPVGAHTPEEVDAAVRAYEASYRHLTRAARRLGICRELMRDRLGVAGVLG